MRPFRRTSVICTVILTNSLCWFFFIILIELKTRNETNTIALFEKLVKSQRPLMLQPTPGADEAQENVNVQANLANETNLNDNNGVLGCVAAIPDDKPGEMGKPFKLGNLTNKQQELVADGWAKNAFNQYASDLISIKRSLKDIRDEWCKKPGRFLSNLIPCSVIICFHNEAWSILLRSVHSVIDRSPPHLIKEVILVDDFSDMSHLKTELESYMNLTFGSKIKIVRATQREGLIRARLLGAAAAKGPVLVFLDSHIEATPGWLEPLIDRIQRNSTIVVCPVIDVLDDETLEYKGEGVATSIGGFDWNLQFTWYSVPEREKKRRNHVAEPLHSPTMAGGLFAIDKKFFEKLGTYDPGFDIWGSENLELSFKTWMCGGTLEIIPCSHVGHIFRKRSPYSWKSDVNVLRKNSVRLAEVWMDDYAKYYYQRISNDLGEYGDISERKAIRRRLNCKSFQWYVDNVYPELFIPGEALSQGEIRNLGLDGNTCLDSPASKKELQKPVGLYPCHGQGGNQYWLYTKTGEIRRDEVCVDYAGQDVMLYLCHGAMGNQHWKYNDKTGEVRHVISNKCLTIQTKEKLIMGPCQGLDSQKWKFENYHEKVNKTIDPPTNELHS